jgi:predicted nucleic acid-binding protein
VIYLDANVLIRLVEGDAAARQPIEQRLAGEAEFLTSQLSRFECRCKPMRDGDTKLLGMYDIAFSAHELRIVELDTRVMDEATAIWGAEKLKTADAIHVAAAVVGGATVFLTGDVQLKRITRLTVELI